MGGINVLKEKKKNGEENSPEEKKKKMTHPSDLFDNDGALSFPRDTTRLRGLIQ